MRSPGSSTAGAVELYRIGTTVTMTDPEGNEFCINVGVG